MAVITNETWDRPLLSLAQEAWQAVTPSQNSDTADAELLQQAHDHCEAITAFHSRSFYMASSLLNVEQRRAVRALYAFCRTSDDIVDDHAGDASNLLQTWRERSLTWQPPSHDLVAFAWADARARHDIPQRYAEQLIDGVARDMVQSRYETFEDLTTYCYGVASTVGLMSMHIIGYESEEAVRYAIKLGVALQLTNILRDVAEDWERGRLYLPLDELKEFGLSEADLEAGIVDDRWREFMKFQIARARQIYEESWPGIQILDASGRFAIAAAATFYRAILDDIEAHDYDVFTRRAHVGKWGKLRRLPSIWWTSKFGK
ncbi:MAG: squalene/phytoene synthase family protein [Chloroflexota bacterium]|nr:MAG: squalene/phytoene synthase family protein [Chloroflexota bacterium]